MGLDFLTAQKTSFKRINQKPSRIPLWSLTYCASIAVMLEAQLGTTLQILALGLSCKTHL
jgi:hypothetical protein